MKTISQIKQEVLSVEREYREVLMPKKIRKHLLVLNQCVLYLETSPNKEFVNHQLETVSKKIDAAKARFTEWLQNTPEAKKVKNPRALYDSEMGLKELRLQLKTLKYLLDDGLCNS